MNEASKMSEEPTLPGFDAPTSSLGSAGGTTLSASLDGLLGERSGREAVLASPSPPRAKEKERPTSDIFGPSSGA